MFTNLTFNLEDYKNYIQPYAFWDNFFTQEELDKILEYGDSLTLDESNSTDLTKKLKSKSISIDTDNRWIFDKLKIVSGAINDEFFKFNLAGFNQIDYVAYCRPGDCYNYHVDISMQDTVGNYSHLTKKLFYTLLLSDPDEYTGGELELFYGEKLLVEQRFGRIIAFPTFMVNKVNPIKIGKRKSIDYFVYGEKFK